MLYFKKSKIKLSLIEDYIEIMKIENFFSNSFVDIEFDKSIFKKCYNLNCKLSKAYNKLFESLKMYDLSLLILRKELKHNNVIYNNLQLNNFKDINQTLLLLLSSLNQTFKNLLPKLKQLKI